MEKNESLKMRSTVFSFEKNEWNSACITTFFQKSLESSRNDSVTNCCKEESRKTSNYFLFTLPLAILFSMLVARTAYRGETDENIEQTPKAQQKNLPFYWERLQNTRPTLKGTSILLLRSRSEQTKFMQFSELKDCYRSAVVNKVEVS